MPMYDPSHPGEIIRHEFIEYLDISLGEAAELLDMDARQLTAIVECREPITLNIARRLSLVVGSNTDMWLRLQAGYDNAPARKTSNMDKRFDASDGA